MLVFPDCRFIAAGDAQPPFFVGVDIGGTNVKLGVVDDLGPAAELAEPCHRRCRRAQEAVRPIGARSESHRRAGLERPA